MAYAAKLAFLYLLAIGMIVQLHLNYFIFFTYCPFLGNYTLK